MSEQVMIRSGQRVVNLLSIHNARRDGNRLWLNYSGGGYEVFDGEQAEAVWRLLLELSIDPRESAKK